MPIRSAWDDLIRPSQKLETVVGGLLMEDKPADKQQNRKKVSDQLNESLIEVNQAYDRLLLMLRRQLLEVEHESSSFR